MNHQRGTDIASTLKVHYISDGIFTGFCKIVISLNVDNQIDFWEDNIVPKL